MRKIKLAAYFLSLTLAAAGAPAPCSAQEDRVAELEKQLRATQQFFAGELAALQKPKEEKKAGGVPLLSVNSEKFGVTGYLQMRYEFVQGGLSPAKKKVAEKNGFAVDRARLKLEGSLDKLTDWRFQLEFRPKTGFGLLDAWAGYNVYDTYARVMVGQAQPKSQGDGDLIFRQFLDQSNSSNTFTSETRDRGLFVNGLLLDKRLTYEAQFVNGNGIDQDSHADTDFRAGLSVRYEILGRMSLFQNDIERGPLQVAAGAAWAASRELDTTAGHQRRQWFISSLHLKRRGLYAKLVGAMQEVDRNSGTGKDQRYVSLQGGYAMPAFAAHMVEPVFRYEILDKNTHADDQKEMWATLGVNYYLKGNNSRIQLNYVSRLEQGMNKTSNNSLKGGVVVMF